MPATFGSLPTASPISLGGLGSGALSAGKGVLDWIRKNPVEAAGLGIAAVGLVQNAGAAGQADDYRKEALQVSRDQYAARQPLRDAAFAGIARPMPVARNLSSVFADPGNPYSRKAQAPSLTPGLPPQQPLGVPPGAATHTNTPLPPGTPLPANATAAQMMLTPEQQAGIDEWIRKGMPAPPPTKAPLAGHWSNTWRNA